MTNDEMLRATNNEDLIVNKKKIVLLRNVKYGFDSVIIVTGDKLDAAYIEDDEYVQLSEITEIKFNMIDVDINAVKINVIDKDIQKAKAGIELLEQAKAELLAISDMRDE